MSMNKIAEYFDRELDFENVVAYYEQGALRNLVEGAFQIDLAAVEILHELFQRLLPGFSFRQFVQEIPKPEEKQAFLTKLLFHIYSIQFPLMRLQNGELFKFYLLQQLASVAGAKTIRAFLKSFSFSAKVKCLGYLFAFYDEGSYEILKEIKGLPVKKLLQEGQIARNSLWMWANKRQKISSKDYVQFERRCKKSIEQKIDKIQALLQTPKRKDVKRFVAIFGLYNHQLPDKLLFLDHTAALDDKLIAMKHYPEEARPFVERILAHIEALSSAKARYRQGYSKLVHALPTIGKELQKLAWLDTTAKSIARFCKLVEASPNPIIVFDQSEPDLFAKNGRYIDSLKKRYRIDIRHLDKANITTLAKRLGFYDLIVTGPNEQIGYGGARNAIFLLAPIFAHKEASFIHMGDDDVAMPSSTIFCDALWAYLHTGQYVARFGYIEGRSTSDINFLPSQVLYQSEAILSQCFWMKNPSLHGMSGLLSPPKLCLNLPFGQEEHHFLAFLHEQFDLRQPAIHLGGSRYPKVDEIPVSRFCGLAGWLHDHTTDIFERLFVTELLDPNNRYHSCALPWNQSEKKCTSFKELLELILSSDPKGMFCKNLLRNVKAFSDKMPNADEILSSHALQELIDSDLKQLHDAFLANAPQFRGAKELSDLFGYFYTLQKEALSFKQYAQRPYPKKTDGLISQILDQMYQSIALGGFQKVVRKLVVSL